MAHVSLISITAVKSLALQHPDEVELTAEGVPENRRLYLVDDAGRLFNGTRHGPLVRIRPSYDDRSRRLALAFPDGQVVEGDLNLGEAVETDFYGRSVRGSVVEGPWSTPLAGYAGAKVRLIRADHAGDACDVHVATLVSEASCAELARHAGADVDPRRFRMLLTLAGCEPHEEDRWIGHRVGVGDAVLRIAGPVPRCAVTTQDPVTGVPDVDTLRGIRAYRGLRDARYADFGVYADVEQPGRVRVGDPVRPV
jgi:uncharacterized protein YcbX